MLEPSIVQKYPTLISLLNRGDPVEVFCFKELHRAVIRLDPAEIFADRISLTSRKEIDQSDRTGRTALSWVAELGELDMITKLLMRGANPNKADVSGRTPLMHCALDIICLTTLLEAGAHVDHLDHMGLTKLHLLVVEQDNLDCAKVLWRSGANINYQANDRNHVRIVLERNRPHLLNWLLEQGADIEAYDNWGKTILLLHIENSQGRYLNMLEILLRKLPNYQTIDDFHEGLPHYIARFGSIRYIGLFQ